MKPELQRGEGEARLWLTAESHSASRARAFVLVGADGISCEQGAQHEATSP